MLVANAHKVTDESGEGFAVRLYRQGRPGGPLTAFSDSPHAFRMGFNKVTRGNGPSGAKGRGMTCSLQGFMLGNVWLIHRFEAKQAVVSTACLCCPAGFIAAVQLLC